MLRHTARLLVVTLILSSGRLLACGWDCLDELPVAAEASCHQPTAPVAAVNGGEAHPCPPEAVDTPVTISQKSSLAVDSLTDGATQTALAGPSLAAATGLPRPPARSPIARARFTNILRI